MTQKFPISKALLNFRYVEEANYESIRVSTWPSILAYLQEQSFLSAEDLKHVAGTNKIPTYEYTSLRRPVLVSLIETTMSSKEALGIQ